MNPHDVEERLVVDRHGRHDFSEVFWCHMGRYVHALGAASALSKRLGRPLRVLDAACGTGYGSYFLSRGGHHCTGIDLDARAVACCRRSYGRPRCRFVAGSVTELPFAPASFDLVVSFETIEHLARAEQQQFIAQIARVLAPNGQLVLSAPVQQGGLDDPSHNLYHQHEPDALELIGALRERFANVETFGQLVQNPTLTAPNPATANATANATATDESATPTVAPASALRRVRGGARAATNALLRHHYLTRPGVLRGVMAALYGGYAVRPLDWREQSATFLVANAQGKLGA